MKKLVIVAAAACFLTAGAFAYSQPVAAEISETSAEVSEQAQEQQENGKSSTPLWFTIISGITLAVLFCVGVLISFEEVLDRLFSRDS